MSVTEYLEKQLSKKESRFNELIDLEREPLSELAELNDDIKTLKRVLAVIRNQV